MDEWAYLGCFLHKVSRDTFGDGDRGAIPEQLSNVWIHLNGEVLNLGDLCISLVDSSCNPVLKMVATDGVHYVRQVLSWKLQDFF